MFRNRKSRVVQLSALSLALLWLQSDALLARRTPQADTAKPPGASSSDDRVAQLQPPSRFNFGEAVQTSRHELRVTVDGSENPALIPDITAYNHFLAATALSDRLTPTQTRLMRSRIARVGLSAIDRINYETVLKNLFVRDELDQIARERKDLDLNLDAATAATSSSREVLSSLKMREKQLLSDARQNVHVVLSSEGSIQLDDYVKTQVKRQIKILGGVFHDGSSAAVTH